MGWHHFLYSFEGSLSGTGTAKPFVDGQLVTQVATSSDPRAGTAMIGAGPTGPTAYIDSLRQYGGSTDPQTICQLGPAGTWLFSTQTCGLATIWPPVCASTALPAATPRPAIARIRSRRSATPWPRPRRARPSWFAPGPTTRHPARCFRS